MKKRLRYILHISLLCIAVLLASCVNTLELVAPRGEGRVMSREVAVADARSYFLTHFGQNTRSDHQIPTHEAPYVVGNLVPDWESGVTMADNERAYTDFAIQKDYRFFLALEDEEQRICGLELYSRLASVVDFELDGMNQYVATYIPDISFLSCYDYFVEEGLLTCEHIDWFTGVVLYTNLWGYHVAAYKYYDGVLVDYNGSGELVWSYCQIDGIVATRPTLKHYISHTAELQSSVNSKYTKSYDYTGTYLSDHLGYNYVSGDVSYDYELLTAISENCDDYGKD